MSVPSSGERVLLTFVGWKSENNEFRGRRFRLRVICVCWGYFNARMKSKNGPPRVSSRYLLSFMPFSAEKRVENIYKNLFFLCVYFKYKIEFSIFSVMNEAQINMNLKFSLKVKIYYVFK